MKKMVNKATKIGLMLIAAVLLVTMVFAGAGAAEKGLEESDPYLITSKSAEGQATWNTDTGVLTIPSKKINKKIVPSYYKLTEDLLLKENKGYINITGTDVHLDLDNKKITKTYDTTTPGSEDMATYALRIIGTKVSVKHADMELSGNIGERSGKFVTITKGNVTIEESTFDFTQIKNEAKSLIGLSIEFFSSSKGGTVYLTQSTVLNGDAGSHKSQCIVISGGDGGVVIDGNKITDVSVSAGQSEARESVCIRITGIKAGDENKIVIKNTELKSASENSGNVGIALDGDKGNIQPGAIVNIDSVDFTFPYGGYEIWKEASKNPTTIKFANTNTIGYRAINAENPFSICFADPSNSEATTPVGTITFEGGDNIPQTYVVYVGASEKSGSLLTGETLKNATLLAGATPVSSTLTVYDSTSLDSDLTIPAKVSFVVDQDVVLKVENVNVATGGKLLLNDGGKITVAAGKSLQLTSDSKLEGTVESLDTTGQSVFSVTTPGTSVTLNGVLNISNQATMQYALGALTITSGYLTPKKDSVIKFSDAIGVTDIHELENALDQKFKNAEIGTWILIGGNVYYVCENQQGPGEGTLKLLQFSEDADYLSTNSVNFGTVSAGSKPGDIDVYLYSTSEATVDFSKVGKFEYEVSGGISKSGKLAPSTLGKITVKAPGTTIPGKFTGRITVGFKQGSQDISLSSNVIEDIQPAEEEKVAKADLPVIDIMEEETGVVIVGNADQLTCDEETHTATLKSSENADVSLTIEGNGVEEVMNSTGYRWVRVPEGAIITATYVSKFVDVIEKKDEGLFKTTLSLKVMSVDLPTLSGSFNEDVAALLESQEAVKAQVMVTAVDTESSLESINANIDTTRENSLEIVIPKEDIESVSNIEVYHVGKEATLLTIGIDYTVEETTDTYIIHIKCNQGFSSYVVSERIGQSSRGHTPSLSKDYTPSSSVEPMVQETAKPTTTPTTTPTIAAPTMMPTTKPTTQQTQKSPAPFVGLIAGLGAAALLIRMRR